MELPIFNNYHGGRATSTVVRCGIVFVIYSMRRSYSADPQEKTVARLENHALVSPSQQQNTISHFAFLHLKQVKGDGVRLVIAAALDLSV